MLTLHLIFLLIYHGLLQTMANHQPIPMVTLGRPFHLGMLYDMRSDRIITGATLWDPHNLANNTVTRKQPYTGFEIITEDSLQNKAHALGLEASLTLSVLSGLISVSGSGKYVEDQQKTNHESRLTLKYSTTTHFEQLTMKHLGKGNLNHPDLHDVDLATHVVTGVLYGAEAFFVFDHTVSNSETKKEINGKLKVIIDRIPKFGIDSEAQLNLTDEEKDFVTKLNCKFYGDFRLSENPSTFAEAVKIYRRLPSLLGEKNENAVPKKVWLYPLHLLDNKAMRTVRDISSSLIDFSISVVEKLHSFEVKALDLSKSAIFIHFNCMKQQLLDFIARLSEVQRALKEKIVVYLPKLRANTGVEESVLLNFFKEVDSSPFKSRKLETWLTEKAQEIALITTWLENLIKDKSLNINIQSPHETIGDIKYTYTFCLTLRFVKENDPQLKDMHRYRYDRSNFNSSTLNIAENRTKWFQDHRSIAQIRKNIRDFLEFAKGNYLENSKIKFIVHEQYLLDNVKSSEISLYHDDGSEKQDFVIPNKPDAPYVKSVLENNLILTWNDAANGTEKVIKYKISYQQYSTEYEKTEQWTEILTANNRTEILISNLPSKTTLIFRVQSVTAIGFSPASETSEPIKILTTKEPITSLALIQAPNNVSVIKTENAKIIVEIIDLIRSNITWLFNGNPIEKSLKYQMETKVQIILNVNQTDSIDSGTYTAIIENGVEKLRIPINMTIQSEPEDAVKKQPSLQQSELKTNRKWKQSATTIAGGNGKGDQLNQLDSPFGIYFHKNQQTIYIADTHNHRVVERNFDINRNQVIASKTKKGSRIDQLSSPVDVTVYPETKFLIICDSENGRTVLWSMENQKNNMIFTHNISCGGLFITDNGDLFVSNYKNNYVKRWRKGEKEGQVIAGGNGQGDRLNQFNFPTFIFVDHNDTVYVSDRNNHRVMKWLKGAKQGIIVAGGQGQGNSFKQLDSPKGVIVNEVGDVYVADTGNNRIMCWPSGAKEGYLVVGGNGRGKGSNQLNSPHGLSFDDQNNLYVADSFNNRIQRFDIDQS